MTDCGSSDRSLRPRSEDRPARSRLADLILASALVALPLLPAGPQYFGLKLPWLFEAAFITTCVLLLVTTAGERATGEAPAWTAARVIHRGYLTWLIAAAGAAAIGVFSVLPPDAALLRFELQGLAARLFGPINQATDPLYPVRVLLTFAEGALAFWVFSRVLLAPGAPAHRGRLAARACLIGISIVSVLAIAQYLTRYQLHPYWVAINPNLVRSHATIDDPNALGSFLVLGMGLAFGLAWSAPSGWAGRRRRWAATTALVLSGLAVGTTVSRAAWLATLVAALWISAFSPERLFHGFPRARVVRRTARKLAFAAALLVVAWLGARMIVTTHVAAAPTSPWGLVVQSLNPQTPLRTVSKQRVVMWSAASGLIADHPIVGVGLGRFPAHYATVPESDGPENAHNFYLQVLAEAGLLGFLAFGAFVLTIVAAFWPGLHAGTRRIGRLGCGLVGGLIAFGVTGLTGHPLLGASNQVWLAAVLAVGLALLNPPEPGMSFNAATVPTRHTRRSTALKRAVDILASIVLLIALSPLMVLTALAIRLFSRGPILFRQQRVTHAKDGGVRTFSLVKFRTMYPEADPYSQSPATPHDPRITSIGRFLRRWCLDELPQLWNVLRGDMSLVGPRPEMPWIVDTYDARSRVRLEVQPGLTGLWQLRGRRDRMIHSDLRWDMVYVRRRGLALDGIILIETLRFVLGARNH